MWRQWNMTLASPWMMSTKVTDRKRAMDSRSASVARGILSRSISSHTGRRRFRGGLP